MTMPFLITIFQSGDVASLQAYAAAITNGEPHDRCGLLDSPNPSHRSRILPRAWHGPISAEIGDALFTIATARWSCTKGDALCNVLRTLVKKASTDGAPHAAFAHALCLSVLANPGSLTPNEAIDVYTTLEAYVTQRSPSVYNHDVFVHVYNVLAANLPLGALLDHLKVRMEEEGEGDIEQASIILASYGLACFPRLQAIVSTGLHQRIYGPLSAQERAMIAMLTGSAHQSLALMSRFGIAAHRHLAPHLIHQRLVDSATSLTTAGSPA